VRGSAPVDLLTWGRTANGARLPELPAQSLNGTTRSANIGSPRRATSGAPCAVEYLQQVR
jgi:hypothetical protein